MQKIIHIVYEDKFKKQSELLQTMISINAELVCKTCTSSEYDKSQNIPSTEMTIYLGDIRSIESSRKIVKDISPDTKYGIHYGFYGTRAFIWHENRPLSNLEKEQFKSTYETTLGKLDTEMYTWTDFKKDIKINLFTTFLPLIAPIPGINSIKNIQNFITAVFNSDKTEDVIKNYAVVSFVTYAFNNFLNGLTNLLDN